MKAAGRTYETVIYDCAVHGFMCSGEDPVNTVSGNRTAYEQGFASLVKHLKELKSAPVASIGGVKHRNLTKAKGGARSGMRYGIHGCYVSRSGPGDQSPSLCPYQVWTATITGCPGT
jgi:hypothetical protein